MAFWRAEQKAFLSNEAIRLHHKPTSHKTCSKWLSLVVYRRSRNSGKNSWRCSAGSSSAALRFRCQRHGPSHYFQMFGRDYLRLHFPVFSLEQPLSYSEQSTVCEFHHKGAKSLHYANYKRPVKCFCAHSPPAPAGRRNKMTKRVE